MSTETNVSPYAAYQPTRWRAGRAQRRRCGRAGHEPKRFEDGTVACVECGEDLSGAPEA